MNRKEFLKIKEELQGKLGKWKLEIGDEIFADFTIGCFLNCTPCQGHFELV